VASRALNLKVRVAMLRTRQYRPKLALFWSICHLHFSPVLCSVSCYAKPAALLSRPGHLGNVGFLPSTHAIPKDIDMMRLRESLHEAKEQIIHLNEDLLDAQAAQERANHALKMKDGQLLSATESLKTLRAELEAHQIREHELYSSVLQQKDEIDRLKNALNSLQAQVQADAQIYAAELFEEMRSDWDANKIIEMAHEKALRDHRVAELQSQVTFDHCNFELWSCVHLLQNLC
jgi:hypothetical protein